MRTQRENEGVGFREKNVDEKGRERFIGRGSGGGDRR